MRKRCVQAWYKRRITLVKRVGDVHTLHSSDISIEQVLPILGLAYTNFYHDLSERTNRLKYRLYTLCTGPTITTTFK
jgi:hypothetical protein